MKTQNNILFQQISTEEIENLTKVVKETVANVPSVPVTLSAAQLWNIQRNGRKLTYKRSIFYA